jgi:uncharacterized glyoxalase superfamily protein PhnB
MYLPQLLALALCSQPAPPATRPSTLPSVEPKPMSEQPRTGQATLTARMPAYPHAKTAPLTVGDSLTAHGMPMFVQTFYTDDGPHEVLAWYRDQFDATELPMMGDGDFTDEFKHPSITVFDEENGVDLHVICIPGDGNGKTLVMLAMADIATFEENLDRATAERWGGLPAYPGEVEPTAFTSTDGEVQTTSVSFTTHDGPDSVIKFYRKALGAAGLREGPHAEASSVLRELEFGGQHGTWRLAIQAETDAATRVFATWTNRTLGEP